MERYPKRRHYNNRPGGGSGGGGGGSASAGPVNALQKGDGAGGFVDTGMTSGATGLSIERVGNKLKQVTKYTPSNFGTGGATPVVLPADLVDGESVTIKVIWSAKDDAVNSGAGGLFVCSWTKSAGVLSKIFDNDTIKGSNSGNGTVTISSSEAAGTISVNFSVALGFTNMAVSWSAELIFTKL